MNFEMKRKTETVRNSKAPPRRSDCAVACALDLVGDRWTLLVIRDLAAGKRYYDELLRSPEGIATNILAARLRTLVEYGLIEKEPDPADQRRSAYRFTQNGLCLRELLGDIADWGHKHIPGTRLDAGPQVPRK